MMPTPSSVPPASEAFLDRRGRVFPKLSDAQIARVARVATTVEVPTGSIVFDEGDYGRPFFVVLEGGIAILHPNGNEEVLITVHGPQEFTGEVSMLADRRVLVRGRATEPSRLLRVGSEIVELSGYDNLEGVVWRDRAGSRTALPIQHVFSMTGAKPNTEWLRGCVELDEKGFILTGHSVSPESHESHESVVAPRFGTRPKAEYETSVPRVFAVGDVRSGSTKRVAAAVGEGSGCISLVHRALAEA